MNPNLRKNLTTYLWIASGLFGLGFIAARVVFSDYGWLWPVLLLLFLASLIGLAWQNRRSLTSRSGAQGLNTVVTVLIVIGILSVVNFFANRYPQKLDMTKNKLHTLSDQTVKVVKGLKTDVQAVFFGKPAQREQVRALLDNLKALNPKFKVDFVDPDKEPTRAKNAGVKKYGTLQLVVGNRDQKIDEANEEKITNTLIKLLKEKAPTVCAIQGHGEKSFNSNEAEGYDAAKKALTNQAYELKEIDLPSQSKIPADCDAIAILGPTKAFFPAEITAVQDYLNQGGRALIALDINLKGGEYAPELNQALEAWHVKPLNALVVDTTLARLGGDPAVAIVASYSKDSPITKDFQAAAHFPFTRPLEIVPGAPAGLNVQWLAQTTPRSWGETDFSQIKRGQVGMDEGKDKSGPLNAAVVVEGKQKDSKATRNTRLVVFGTSYFATNNFSRFGGNLDLFMNATSWLMEDESLISIRAKEDGPGKIELSQRAGNTIALLTIVVIPLLVAVAGVVIWVMRRRL